MHDITTAQTKDLNVEEIEEISVFIHHLPATGEDDFSRVDNALALCRTHLVTVFMAARIESPCVSKGSYFPHLLSHLFSPWFAQRRLPAVPAAAEETRTTSDQIGAHPQKNNVQQDPTSLSIHG